MADGGGGARLPWPHPESATGSQVFYLRGVRVLFESINHTLSQILFQHSV